MSTPFPLLVSYTGMTQDVPRDELPSGKLWDCADFIPIKLGEVLAKRGGWTYASPALTGESYVQGLCRTPAYGAGEFNVAVGGTGAVLTYTNSTQSSLGTAFAVSQNPFVSTAGNPALWMVVIPAASGTTTPKSWDGTTFQDLAGTPPKAIYGAPWNGYALLANGEIGSTAHPGRLWFSAAGDCTTWDTTNSWFDFDDPVVGIGILRTGILVFHARTTSRLTGTTPPNASALGDLVEDDPFTVGCLDARSITYWNDNVIWAGSQGVYMTDGTTITDLTEIGGMKNYWKSQLTNFGSGWRCAAGIYRDNLMVAIVDNTGAMIACLVLDLNTVGTTDTIWYRFTNFPGLCFMSLGGQSVEKTVMGLGSSGHVADMAEVFHFGNSSDGDGTAIQPQLQTGLFRGFMHLHRKWIQSMAIQSWRRFWLNYEMVDGGSAPTLTVSYATDIDASWTAISTTLPAASLTVRKKLNLFFQGRGVMFKIAQTNASTDTKLRAIELEFSPLEAGRLAQS